MRALDLASGKVLSVAPDTTLAEAYRVMKRNRISHLLVTEEERLVAVLSERDLLSKLGVERTRRVDLGRLHVSSFYSEKPIYLPSSASVARVIRVMLNHNIGIVPLLRNNSVEAVVTKQDLMPLAEDVGERSLGDIMSAPQGFVKASSRLLEARQVLLRLQVSSVPVVEELRPLGVIYDTTVVEALVKFYERVEWRYRSARLRNILAQDVMRRGAPFMSPETPVGEAARVFSRGVHKAVLVTIDENLVGIVAKSDIINLLSGVYASTQD